jgi:hypothetical protein
MKVRFTSALVAALTACVMLPAASAAAPASQGCDESHHSDTGHGANQGGPYDSTCDGSPSGNGNGNGQATGKPCAGCVGNADDKNPKGQMPNGSDHNAGYECDRNHGIGRTNPAHTGCRLGEQPTTPTEGGQQQDDENEGGKTPCPKFSNALTQAAAVVLKAVAAAHPEIAKLSELAQTKVASNCGNNGEQPANENNGNGHTPITICHATGSATNPFVEITIDENGLNGHGDHQDDRDIIPAPAEGCPTGEQSNTPPVNTPEQPPLTQPEQPVVPPLVVPTQTGGPAPESSEAPATNGQEVLGVRAEGGSTPTTQAPGTTKVLGENASGGTAPAAAAAPAVAQRAVQAGDESGSLPFTGTDALLVLFLGCLMLLLGVTLQRVLARN